MNDIQQHPVRVQKPRWLTRQLPKDGTHNQVRELLETSNLHTVCQEAKCPNIWECFSRRTATFLILGDHCTRNCRFCAVAHGPLGPPDPDEPARVARAAEEMRLGYVVVTSVTRDDVPDGGAGIFAETVQQIHERLPHTLIELLIPDFRGDSEALEKVLKAGPDVLNHNVETVPRLYPIARPSAVYQRSLELLKNCKDIDPSIPTKTGIMLGLGEKSDELKQTLQDLLEVDCDILTLGQYLQPRAENLPVDRFVEPEEFEKWRETALAMGFKAVASGPFVRSSYNAKGLYETVKGRC